MGKDEPIMRDPVFSGGFICWVMNEAGSFCTGERGSLPWWGMTRSVPEASAGASPSKYVLI